MKEFTNQPVVGHGLLSPHVGVRLEVGELVDGDVDLGDGRRVVDVPHRPQEGGLQSRLGDQLFEGHLGDSKIAGWGKILFKSNLVTSYSYWPPVTGSSVTILFLKM